MSSQNNSYQIKARILKISYNRDNNIFQLLLEDIENNKQTGIAIKGTDWGVTSDIPEEVINEFCEDMIGKEKNIYIKIEQSSLKDAKKDDKGLTLQEEINKTLDNLNNYPIDEIMNVLHEDIKEDEN